MGDAEEIRQAYAEYATLKAEYDAAIQAVIAGDVEARARAIELVPARDAAWARLAAAIPVRTGKSML